jgi:Protein of unknown function (DUF3568)
MKLNPRFCKLSPVVAIAFLIFTSGCAAVLVGGAAGAGVAYSMGQLKSVESAPLEKVYGAVQVAERKLQFDEVDSHKDALEGLVEMKMASDRTVTVKLKRLAESSTEIRIRVGTFGDEAVSRQVLEAIHAAL